MPASGGGHVEDGIGSSVDPALRFLTSPEAALQACRLHAGPLLLDLDETAYLQNSTEDFLDSAQPALVALLLLRLLDLVRPWRWTGGDTTRDVWRVRCVATALPWIWRAWQRRVDRLAAEHGNPGLLRQIAARAAPTHVVTAGFRPIVTPLISALALPLEGLVAPALSLADRRAGKLQLVLDRHGAELLARSAVLTDSSDDLPLLDRCALPLRTLWPGARYRHALGRVYLPGQYLALIKRPGQRYLLRGILQEDFAFWLLATLGTASLPLLHALGMLALLVSFWAIYERGYVDNDWVAAHWEAAPKLSSAYGRVHVATPALAPWLWAAACGLLAITLLRWPAPVAARDALAWSGVLLATHFGFRAYNRVDKATRIWMFPALQLLRSASFMVLVPVGTAAALALGAHVIARWLPYYLYRVGGNEWPEAPLFLSRLMIYSLLCLIVALSGNPAAVMTGTAAALLAWNLFRARRELAGVLQALHRIDRPPAP